MKRYSVSLVYQRHNNSGSIDNRLRCSIIEAVSEEEALGKAIKSFTQEMVNFGLGLHVVVLIDDNLTK